MLKRSIVMSRFEVLTSNGFKSFETVSKSIHDKYLKLTFSNGSTIECTYNHKFYIDDNFIYAKDLKIGDKVTNAFVTNIIKCNKRKEFFDLINVEDGHHFTANGIEVSNCAYIPTTKWNDFVDGVLPSQSSLAWKKTIFLSTPNGMNHFYDIVQGAKKHKIIEDIDKENIKNYNNIINTTKNKDGTYNIELDEPSNNFKLISVDWREVPRYDSKGNKLDPEEFRKSIIEKNGIIFFNQAYACEFIGSSYTLISADTLKTFNSKNPIDYYHIPNSDQVLNVYEEVIENHKYMISIDGSKNGGDNFAVQILDITTLPFKQVCSGKLKIDYLLMPSFIAEIGLIYNSAFIVVENNEGAGQSIADMLFNTYEYPNLYFDKDGKNKFKKYPGFRTTPKSRDQILKTLKLMLENDQLLIYDNDTIKEFFTFILKGKKFQADDGYHDDMVMSLAVAMCIFSNTNNFEDMRVIIDNIYSKKTEDNVDIVSILTIGNFDDGVTNNDVNFNIYDYNYGI